MAETKTPETPEDHVYLQGLALRYYRGIGEETQYIAPFSKLNFFVGPNNSGKSIVLNYVSEFLPLSGPPIDGMKQPWVLKADDPRKNVDSKNEPIQVAFGFPIPKLIDRNLSQLGVNQLQMMSLIAESLAKQDNLWVIQGIDTKSIRRKTGNHRLRQPEILCDEAEDLYEYFLANNQYANDPTLASHRLRSIIERDGFNEFLTTILSSFEPMRKATSLIPAKRIIGQAGEEFSDQSGRGLIDELARHQNPDHHELEKRHIFQAINRFLQTVTDRPDAQIEVPHGREHLLVHMDGKTLPLSNLGTGIHEVILIAAFCTLKQDQIICIEEPEIHLHPILQRKLIRYLMERTTNQYFIATHSAALIDTTDASVFRVTNDGIQTRIRHAISPSDRGQICDDLGYLASDILQANFVIWVEGPSDRIYLRHWIKAYRQKVGKPELIEGVHYTIMFYGGGLLSHLSADAEEVEDFIKLRQINRNMAVVMDSDKSGPRAKIGAAKLRIKAKMSDDPSLAWITKGREIENYLPFDLLQAKAKAIHSGSYGEPGAGGTYDHAFKYVGKDKKIRDCDKVKLAHALCAEPVDWTVLDLEARVASLVAAIEKANGKEAA